MKKNNRRLISFLLSFSLVLTGFGVFVSNVVKAEVEPDPIVVVACSDFQHPSGNAAGQEVVRNLIGNIQDDGYEEANGFLCCGDYSHGYLTSVSTAETYIGALRSVVEECYGPDLDMTFVQGNHDQIPIGSAGLSPSGNNDTDNYGVFVINEDDYMWYNNDEARIKQTAENLHKYLYGKRNARYTKPIFVVSHLPLHYSMRTRNDGDGQYAKYIFNELNDAGANGLNIIFLFGHNHSHGWDDYLGGAAIYQEKGEELLISDGTRNNYTRETLEFTYMNAGYVGYYYGNENERNAGADDTLTMTVFEIRDDKIIVSRVDKDGLHNMKSSGVSNESENHNEKANGKYDPLDWEVESPTEIDLSNNVIPLEDEEWDYGSCDHVRIHRVDIKEPSCTEKGYDGDDRCTDCGEIVDEGFEIDALGHDWDAGVITTPSTKDSEGVKTYKCRRCGEVKAEVIPKIAGGATDTAQNPVTDQGKQVGPTADTLNAGSVKSAAISSAKNTAKKTVVVKWKKSADAKGYQIWYALRKNFKGKKVINVKNGKTTKVTVKKLKVKKTYFFKIRVLGVVDGKETYSGWSKVKSVKVKK